MVAPFMPDDEKLAAVRDALPAVRAGIYLNTPVAGPLPAETAASMSEIAGWELTTGRAHRDRRGDVLARIDEARGAAAAVLTADIDDVLIARGYDDALAKALRTVELRAGDQVAVARGEHIARIEALLPRGVETVWVEPATDGAPALSATLAGGGVRLVALPLVSGVTGARAPIEAMARAAHDGGAAVLVDVSLAVGAVAVDREALGADLLVTRSEAWLLGPEGLAVLAGRRDRLALLGDDEGFGERSTDSPQPVGFHLPSVVGFGRSCGWLSMYVGLGWIHARGAALTARASERLRAIDGVEVLTPEDAMATVIVFRIAEWPVDVALDELGARVFALASSVPALDAIRIGLGFFNTEDEVDRFASAVELLARHTPATIPQRQRLTVIGTGA
ncbi:MAG TPA: aminotransferase class V-fold PLP-dependent enzyme [Candidatus Limnocylindrales bacterium]